MTASPATCEMGSSKATTTLSTRIIVEVPVRLVVHRRTQHTWHVVARRPA